MASDPVAATRRRLRARTGRRTVRARLVPRTGRPAPVLVALSSSVARVRRAVAPPSDEAEVIEVLAAAAAGLRAGLSPSGALDEAARAGTDGRVTTHLRGALRRHRQGSPLEVALLGWADARPSPPVQLAVAVISLGLATGGDLAQALDGAAATLRQRLALRAEVGALASQARSSALVVAVAPVAFTALAGLTDPRVPAFLVGSPLGWACALGGLGLDVVGALWMRAITARVGR